MDQQAEINRLRKALADMIAITRLSPGIALPNTKTCDLLYEWDELWAVRRARAILAEQQREAAR